MKVRIKNIFIIMMLFVLVLSITVQGQEANNDEKITAQTPIITTTCGQSPGALMVAQICKTINLEIEQKDLLKADYLKENEFNTIIITMGTSGKGMGAAGTNMKSEANRINEIIKVAKEKGMIIIGAHIEGEARRVDDNDAKSIEIVAPKSDIIIVRTDSNKDGYFTELGEEKEIPVYVIEQTLELTEPLKEIFEIE